MALGTLTPVRGANTTLSNKRWRVFDVQLTSGANYTTGGETITAAAVGLRKIDQVLVSASARTGAGTTARPVAFDYTNSKLQAYNGDGGVAGPLAEVAANSDLSIFTVRIAFIGT